MALIYLVFKHTLQEIQILECQEKTTKVIYTPREVHIFQCVGHILPIKKKKKKKKKINNFCIPH